ncbi:hypothetical protein GCM10011594_15560 [Nakamurella endophytica]|uniref:Small ribosomal subunit protein bS18 n=2 Tax=Nakamurella endophytica TaxID=1748367 RepID=A0A917SUZ2_9ACTN|nr:hypothetical protein GCM10011594_15560 [Nakamurella endophytica]
MGLRAGRRRLLRRAALLTVAVAPAAASAGAPPSRTGTRPTVHDNPRKTCEAMRERRQSSKPAAANRKVKKKVCAFCKDNAQPIDYKDLNLLRKFISDRGKIRARRVTGNCTQHQRDVATAVKNAREVALLPYTSTAR